ncbi:hypothetical protein EDD21DRAFT_362008 [Dissophora ornata]|nr:hypothetical protein BGZ58_010335 [Dissophora ornata]KAI8606035.1 hypothetical protein EDD21DRAFT_362008 [Dissophora ornata]
MPPLNVFEIPELILHISRHLTPHELTVCLRVSSAWFESFISPLYENITIFDFDYYKLDVGAGLAIRTENNRQQEPPYLTLSQGGASDASGYGGSQVHKYGHLVRTICTAYIQSAQYLGDCTHLTCISIYPSYEHHFLVEPRDHKELALWSQYRTKNMPGKELARIWVELIERNHALKVVKMDLQWFEGNMHLVAKALGALEELEEIHLCDLGKPNELEVILEHCTNIRTLIFAPGFYNVKQIFIPRPMVGKTRLQYLDISNQASEMRGAESIRWLDQLLERCPELERLGFPKFAEGNLFTDAAAIIPKHCPNLRRLDFKQISDTNCSQSSRALGELLNSCPQLRAVSLDLPLKDFSAEHQLREFPELRERLEEFRSEVSSSDLLRSNAVFLILELCPNLRVFDVRNVVLTVEELLHIQWSCRDTLQSLGMTVSQMDDVTAADPESLPEQPGGASPVDEAVTGRCQANTLLVDQFVQLKALEELRLDYVVPAGQGYKKSGWKVDGETLEQFRVLKELRVLCINGSYYRATR